MEAARQVRASGRQVGPGSVEVRRPNLMGNRFVWWWLGSTVSALASLAPRVVEDEHYRLGARFARASCSEK